MTLRDSSRIYSCFIIKLNKNTQGKCMFNLKNYLFSVLVLSFGMLNTNLIAQDESADEDVEEVIVTGTRLKANGFEAVSPVSVVTADNIKRTGQTRIEDILNQMPQIETSNSSFEPSGETGTASLDLC